VLKTFKHLKIDETQLMKNKIITKIKRKIQISYLTLERKIQKGYSTFNSKMNGDKLPFFCPCCGTYLRDFADGHYTMQTDMYNTERYRGIDQRVICPICQALPRHRILVSWFNNNIEKLIGQKILYFAPETSVMMWLSSHNISCTTADLYNIADLTLNIEETGLADEAYDIIVCNHVLEHVSDYKKALKELYRITKSDGLVIISFPVDLTLDTVYEDPSVVSEKDCLRCFGQKDHRRVFGRDSGKILEAMGFSVSEISGEADDVDKRIKPVIGPADYDYNVLWCLTKKI